MAENNEQEANVYFQTNFETFWEKDLLEIVEQKTIIPLARGTNDYKLGEIIQPGSKLTVSSEKENHTDATTGTLGCFMQDNNGDIYAVTSAHIFQPHMSQHSAVHVNLNISASVKSKEVVIGSKVFTSELDFALVKINTSLLEIKDRRFSLMNIKLQEVQLNIFSEPDENLIGKEVRKIGAHTEETYGNILLVQVDICTRLFCKSNRVNRISNVFIIQKEKIYRDFCDNGDSGSLVTCDLLRDDGTGIAYGICTSKAESYKHFLGAEAVTYDNVTFAVRLDQCLRFAEKSWGLSLNFAKTDNYSMTLPEGKIMITFNHP